MTFGSFISRLSAALIAGSLAFTLIFAAVHAAEDQRKVTVVSFGLFGGQGVFRREATGAAEIVANRFGADPVVVRFNTKTGGDATVEALAATLQAETKKMNGDRDILFLILTRRGLLSMRDGWLKRSSRPIWPLCSTELAYDTR